MYLRRVYGRQKGLVVLVDNNHRFLPGLFGKVGNKLPETPGRVVGHTLGQAILFFMQFKGYIQLAIENGGARSIIPRVKIDVDDRMLFPLPLKALNGQSGLPRDGAEKVPPPLEEGPQRRTEQGLPEAPGPGKKKTPPDPVTSL